MNKKTVEIEYAIPEWAICYLVNSDNSGLSEQEIEQLDRFWKYEQLISISVTSENAYFARVNDVDNIGCNVYDCNCLCEVI
ncbi:unnamed protein product [marine sediment metagenome]|uniref:DUF6926 domain-containing protein n=1 Tax=marine sediment metagenome TaxID=412755 RepID=X0VSR3_9ZZZZ